VEPDPAHERRRYKAQQTTHWNSVATGWAARVDWTEKNFAPLTEWLRTTGCWRQGSVVLDVACGSGYPAVAAARAVGSSGRVVAADIAPEMVAVAARRARQSGVDNIEFSEMDAEALRFGPESFDAVTNTYGLMFCPDPERAVGEMRRVLRPGGRMVVAVWGHPRQNPFFDVMFTAGKDVLGLAPPDAGDPGPFRLASADRLGALLRGANLSHVVVEPLAMTFETASVDDFVQMFSDLALKSRMARLSTADRARLRIAVAETARPHLDRRGRVRLQTTSLCATAIK
jgi:SAM-dependent methyltransferase